MSVHSCNTASWFSLPLQDHVNQLQLAGCHDQAHGLYLLCWDLSSGAAVLYRKCVEYECCRTACGTRASGAGLMQSIWYLASLYFGAAWEILCMSMLLGVCRFISILQICVGLLSPWRKGAFIYDQRSWSLFLLCQYSLFCPKVICSECDLQEYPDYVCPVPK